MNTDTESAILSQSYSVEVSEMPHLQCAACNHAMEINIGEITSYNKPNSASAPEKLIGSAICRNCSAGTGFELENNVVVYVSGKSAYGSPNEQIPIEAKVLYAEAELCFQSGAPNSSVAMCRASIEIALDKAEITGKDLYEMIGKAKTKNVLDDIEVSMAHGSRLVTRGAIHRGELVQLSDVPSMLSATVRILNKLVRVQPNPEQSR